jgi:hypothetical protein
MGRRRFMRGKGVAWPALWLGSIRVWEGGTGDVQRGGSWARPEEGERLGWASWALCRWGLGR